MYIRTGRTKTMPYNAEHAQDDANFKRSLSKGEIAESKAEYSINNRPEEINKRLHFEHFELDTVIGARNGKHECLMTLTERKTRYEIIFKLKGKTSSEVVNKFNKMKKFTKNNYDKIFKSITTDNGTEFSDFKSIIKDTKTKCIFVTLIVLEKKALMKNIME